MIHPSLAANRAHLSAARLGLNQPTSVTNIAVNLFYETVKLKCRDKTNRNKDSNTSARFPFITNCSEQGKMFSCAKETIDSNSSNFQGDIKFYRIDIGTHLTVVRPAIFKYRIFFFLSFTFIIKE